MWLVYNPKTGLYWTNEHGWVGDIHSADIYDDEEKLEYDLPIDGTWISEPPKHKQDLSDGHMNDVRFGDSPDY
jgi:hypothetical protein